MELFIIRHAWAEPYGDPAWPDDTRRPLTEKGRERFAEVVKSLARRGFAPGVIATSPMVRCVETAEIVAARVAGSPKLVEREELLPGGDLGSLLAWTDEQSHWHEQVAWVGHAPDIGRLAAAAIGGPAAAIRFSKGAIAAIRFDAPPQAGCGELRWLVTAKVLDV